MTADYNGWNDAPEAEREAMDLYSRQEFGGEALAHLALQKFARRLTGSRDGAEHLVSCVAEEITRAIDALPETYRATYRDLRPAA